MKTKRLGRGLDALIPQQSGTESAEEKARTGSSINEIETAKVSPNPYQPRVEFDPESLNDLKNSIKEKGLIQPITVRKVDNRYELIAGERRLRAAIEVGLEKIPAYIVNVETKEEMLELAIIENVQREKLNPIEQANAFQRLIDECSLTQDEVAQKIGKDRSTITNILRLLKLPADIQAFVKTGDLSIGHARALLSVESNSARRDLSKKTIRNQLSVRRLEKMVQELSQTSNRKPIKTARESVFVQKIEEKLKDILGTKVTIRSKKEGGSIEIEFYSAEDLNRLVEIIEEKS